MNKPVGVVGSGSFGITIAKLLSENRDVILYSRRQKVIDSINNDHFYLNTELNSNIVATKDMQHLCKSCDLIFPVIPSSVFRSVASDLSPFLHPYHILIHCTKGLDVSNISEEDLASQSYTKKDVCTMSEVLLDETSVIRVGCMSGPNLAKELLAGLPAATVIASEFDEVIKLGQEALSSSKFTVFGSHDLKGAELAGAYKNIVALAAGIVKGMGYGKNMEALLITRGLHEMIDFGVSLGLSGQAFMGTAGIGDMIATATSEKSRNFTFGLRYASGESLKEILATSDEVIEGLRTLQIVHTLAQNENILLPITRSLYKVIFGRRNIKSAIDNLIKFQYGSDVNYSLEKIISK
jgi:glycerol-3-phosphate dehydrogenase (NAD(P)+)